MCDYRKCDEFEFELLLFLFSCFLQHSLYFISFILNNYIFPQFIIYYVEFDIYIQPAILYVTFYFYIQLLSNFSHTHHSSKMSWKWETPKETQRIIEEQPTKFVYGGMLQYPSDKHELGLTIRGPPPRPVKRSNPPRLTRPAWVI